jgi:two-component sensor histidine kinase/PAS domain-containing protein
MIVQVTYFAVAFAIATAICSALSLYVWQRRRVPGGSYFALFLAAAALWALTSALENSVADMPSKILFSELAYLGVATVAPLWWLFTLDYSRRSRWLRSRWMQLIWAVPAATIVLAFTNEWHGLVWTSIVPVSAVPGATLVYAPGPAVWVHMTYAYVLLLSGSIILLDARLRAFRRSHLPTVTMVLGILVSLVANLLYPTTLNPFKGMDITPLAFTVSGLLFTWAIFRQQLFELVPVAREMLLQIMSDGAIVLDGKGNVAEINPAAQRMLDMSKNPVALDAGHAASMWPALAGCFHGGADAGEEVRINGPEGVTWLDTRVSLLHDSRGMPAGRLVVLRDITKRKLAEEELMRSNEALSASVHEKEVLLKEIHHRVKNNLQIVSSILSLQSDSTGGESLATALKDSQDRIRSMALIHEKLYQSRDISRVDFAEYVRSLTAGLSHSYMTGPGVSIVIDIERIFLDIDQAIPCGLIINELVTNSLKYAFPDRRPGEIRISLARNGGNCVLTVTDNGVGLPPGLDFRNTPSLGLQLACMLTGQLEGTIELDPAGGTRFKITFAEIE